MPGSGHERSIDYDQDDLEEWLADLVREKDLELLKKEPQKAIDRFLSIIAERGLTVDKKALTEEEILSLANRWFKADDEADKEEVYEEISDYLSSLTVGFSDPRDVVLEVSKSDIAKLGIRGGVLYEEAPWKLIKLHPGDLRAEGAVMNHCVGDAGMGYIKAVKDGDIEIWSFRSRGNKPRFTLEVRTSLLMPDNVSSRDREAPPVGDDLVIADWILSWRNREDIRMATAMRAQAIEQVKGNSNRTPGFARARDTNSFKFPDEVTLWEAIFTRLAIDPTEVDDMKPAVSKEYGPEPVAANKRGEVCTGFDLPYQPMRKNRRSSKRRSSKRRSSRRR